MYWLAYAVPLFWTKHQINLIMGMHQLSENAITQSLYLVVFGVAALGIGMAAAGRLRFMESFRLDIHRSPARWHYLRFVLLASALLRIAVPINMLGGGGRQFLAIIETIVPSVAFVILLRYYLRGTAIPVDKILLAGYAGIALVAGISSGWLGSFVGVAIMAAAVYVYERRKLPLIAIMIGIPIVLFLQPGKEKFRQQYWRAGASESYVERFNFWMDSSWSDMGRGSVERRRGTSEKFGQSDARATLVTAADCERDGINTRARSIPERAAVFVYAGHIRPPVFLA